MGVVYDTKVYCDHNMDMQDICIFGKYDWKNTKL